VQAYQIRRLTLRIDTLWSKNGPTFTVQYLKNCCLLVNKMISGENVSDLSEPRVASRRGLPLIIPGSLRLQIEAQDLRVIKVVLSLLSVYRLMKSRSQYKLETIYTPFNGVVDVLPLYEIKTIYKAYFFHLVEKVRPETNRFSWMKKETPSPMRPLTGLLPISTAGPNVNPSMLGYYLDALAFKTNPALLDSLRKVSKYTSYGLLSKLDKEVQSYPEMDEVEISSLNLKLGKLSDKFEPAGKIRVFAILDG